MAPREFASPQEVSEEVARRGLPANFCHVPFAALILEPDGRVGSCRIKGTEFPVGNLNESTLEEIWNGPRIRQWRREFLNGDVKMCRKEVRHTRCHTCAEYNELLPEVEATEYQTRPPLRLALNFNGHCNLECQMCHIWKEPNGLYDARGWWDQAEKWVGGIQELELLSGEPFIQKDTYRLIDLVAERNPSCRWSITTNGHWRLTDGIRRALDKIRFKHLIVSLDSLNPTTYSKIRKLGRLEVPLANLDRLLEYDQSRIERGLGPLNIYLSFLIQRDNWRELGDFHEFAKRKGTRIFRIFLYEPRKHSLLSLRLAERERIVEHYIHELSYDQLIHSRRAFLPLLDSLPALARARLLLDFQRRISEEGEVGA